jgi:DNA-binding LytR/AlgR family response regulator
MNIKCIIIDDDSLAIKIIEKYLKQFQNFNIVGTFNNPIAAITILDKEDIDVLFLDIHLYKINGLEFVKTLNFKPNIVVTTAYREYAVESYEIDVLDYLIKPIPFNRFLKAINKITQKVYIQKSNQKDDELKNDSFIFLKVNKKLVKIKFNDIFYIESLKDYIKIFTSTGDYFVHKSLTSITEELPKKNFIRIHRSYIIAIDKVVSVEGNLVEITSKRIPIGRKYVNYAKQIILNKS